ncbi:MAG: cytochrome C oxidase subunit IV family protein [Phycisphaeraceae bacterium]|nr:cytochrome C oxidase subunit IV family protein [Phycisphaeraceae bacterium]
MFEKKPNPEFEAAGQAKGESHHDGHGGEHVHAVPLSLLTGIFVILMILTGLTVAATWVELGALNVWVALLIALVKAAFVALYFMHLRWDSPFNSFVLITSLVFVVLFIGVTLMDSLQYQSVIERLIERQAP